MLNSEWAFIRYIMDVLNLSNVNYTSMDILKEVFQLNEGSACNTRNRKMVRSRPVKLV